jgi:hypothetical protein
MAANSVSTISAGKRASVAYEISTPACPTVVRIVMRRWPASESATASMAFLTKL